MSECGIEQTAYQKSIGQPIAQDECDILNDTDRLVGNKPLVSTRSGMERPFNTRELAVVNIRNGLNVKLRRRSYSHDREHEQGVGYDPPFDRPSSTMVGVKQCGHTLEEHDDDDPWNDTEKRSEHGWAVAWLWMPQASRTV